MPHHAARQLIKRTVNNANEGQIWECMLTFNQHILKTNFFQPTKVRAAIPLPFLRMSLIVDCPHMLLCYFGHRKQWLM
jgi:NAD-specific glutamate dehydrogenase